MTFPVRTFTTEQLLTGNRSSSFRIDLLDQDENKIGVLSGVTGGNFVFTANAVIKGAGSLTVKDSAQNVDFLNARIQPILTIEGIGETSLGVFFFSENPESWGDTGRTFSSKVLDKCGILDQDKVEVTYVLDAGTVITDAVVTLITSTGETNYSITPSTATLASPLEWDPGTTKLQIINDLLDKAGYFSLFCDGSGQYKGEPYVRPGARPVMYAFVDGKTAIFLADFDRDIDLHSIPNKVIVTSQGDGTTAGLVSVVTNTDPTSPYSTVSRGRTIAYTETGVEIADQTTLDTYARRRLIELTAPTSTVQIQHLFVPGLTANSVVTFRRIPAGIDSRHVLSQTTIDVNAVALVKSTLTEVVDL